MQTKIKLVHATEEHAEGISKVICDALVNVNARDYAQKDIDRLVNNFAAPNILDLMKHRLTLIALYENLVIGTGALQGSEIKSVFVSPDVHREGVGRTLMEALEQAAAERGLQELFVSSSLSAVSFYTALGYVENGRQFFGDEETVVMIKPVRVSR